MPGLLAGAAAGAIAGILLAPDKGSVTRKNLSRKSSDAFESIKDRFSNFVDMVSDRYLTSSVDGAGGLQRTRSTASHLNQGTPGY